MMRSHPNRQSRFNPYSGKGFAPGLNKHSDMASRFQSGLEGPTLLLAEELDKPKRKKKVSLPKFSFMVPPPEEEITED